MSKVNTHKIKWFADALITPKDFTRYGNGVASIEDLWIHPVTGEVLRWPGGMNFEKYIAVRFTGTSAKKRRRFVQAIAMMVLLSVVVLQGCGDEYGTPALDDSDVVEELQLVFPQYDDGSSPEKSTSGWVSGRVPGIHGRAVIKTTTLVPKGDGRVEPTYYGPSGASYTASRPRYPYAITNQLKSMPRVFSIHQTTLFFSGETVAFLLMDEWVVTYKTSGSTRTMLWGKDLMPAGRFPGRALGWFRDESKLYLFTTSGIYEVTPDGFMGDSISMEGVTAEPVGSKTGWVVPTKHGLVMQPYDGSRAVELWDQGECMRPAYQRTTGDIFVICDSPWGYRLLTLDSSGTITGIQALPGSLVGPPVVTDDGTMAVMTNDGLYHRKDGAWVKIDGCKVDGGITQSDYVGNGRWMIRSVDNRLYIMTEGLGCWSEGNWGPHAVVGPDLIYTWYDVTATLLKIRIDDRGVPYASTVQCEGLNTTPTGITADRDGNVTAFTGNKVIICK